MRKLFFAFLVCSTTAAFAQKTNFSGTWKLDTNRTTFGSGPKYTIPWNIKVDQQSDQLVLIRIPVNETLQDLAPIKETLAFDGTSFQQTFGGRTVTTKITWLNNNSFSLTRNGNLNATETWMLEDAGKTLVIDRAVEQTENGFKYTIKGYYQKQ